MKLIKIRKIIITMILLAGALLLACMLPHGKAQADEETTISFCDGTNQGNPRQFSAYGSVGFRFEVPEGSQLVRFTVTAAPTWGTQNNAGFTADIYKWTGDYETTLEGGLISTCVISQHQDNHAINMSFGYIPAGTYLIHIHNFTDVIGTWEAIGFPAKYSSSWGYYQNGVEETSYLPGTAMTVTADSDPQEVTPYVTPTANPDGEVTEVPVEETPAPTEPEKTRSRMTEAPVEVDTNESKAGLIAGIAVGAVMIAGTVAAILIVSHRDRKKLEEVEAEGRDASEADGK